jgi:ribosome biogenesis GTPase
LELEGIVTTIQSVECTVDTDQGEFRCTMRGRLSTSDTGHKKPVTVGDRVRITKTAEKKGVVNDVLPRKTKLSRTHPSEPRKEHVLAANVDRLMIVAAAKNPPLSVGLIDRYIVAAEYGGIDPVICINKIDLCADQSEYMGIAELYRDDGYTVLSASALQKRGIDRIKEELKGHITVFAGHSGVGKSSLINAIQPGLKLKTAPIGWKGTHCTSSVTLLKLDIGGYVVDTPGIRELQPWDIEKHELQQFFPKIWKLSADCRLPDCTHIHEPDCAVKDALEKGELSKLRYESYAGILDSLEKQTEPRRTDVEQPKEQVSKSRRRPSRRTQKQDMERQMEEELEEWERRH